MTDLRLFKRVLCVLAAGLVVVACSSSSKSSSSSPTTSGSQSSAGSTGSTGSTGSPGSTGSAGAAAATGSPIVIGGICTCTGGLTGNNPGAFDPYKAWVNTVNAQGGINSHPVKFIGIDDKNNPGLSVAAAHTLVQSDHVIAIVDTTGLDEGWASYVQGANVPVVGSGNSSTPFFMNPDFYSEGQTEDALVSLDHRSRQDCRVQERRPHLLRRGRSVPGGDRPAQGRR